ncbi:MAG: hypothetical protein AAGM67_15765, partial [Bacteroidota bacterium]
MANTPTIIQDQKTADFIAPFIGDAVPATGESVRLQAQNTLNALSLPGRKAESWKYTPLRNVQKRRYQAYASSSTIDISPYLIEGMEADLLVFVNGQYQADLSSINLNADVLYVSDLQNLSGAGI